MKITSNSIQQEGHEGIADAKPKKYDKSSKEMAKSTADATMNTKKEIKSVNMVMLCLMCEDYIFLCDKPRRVEKPLGKPKFYIRVEFSRLKVLKN